MTISSLGDFFEIVDGYLRQTQNGYYEDDAATGKSDPHFIARNLEHEYETRKELVPFLKWGIVIWLILVLMIVIWSGITLWPPSFHLSDTVLVTLLATTTANVIGLVAIMVGFYFKNKNPNS